MSEDTANLIYEAVEPLDWSKTYKSLLSDDIEAMVRAVLTISWQDDWQYAQDVCFKFARHNDPDVSRISVIGLGHIARIHGMIDLESVLELAAEINVRGRHVGELDDMLSDIMVYVARRGSRG